MQWSGFVYSIGKLNWFGTNCIVLCDNNEPQNKNYQFLEYSITEYFIDFNGWLEGYQFDIVNRTKTNVGALSNARTCPWNNQSKQSGSNVIYLQGKCKCCYLLS